MNRGWLFYKKIYHNTNPNNPSIDSRVLQQLFGPFEAIEDEIEPTHELSLSLLYPGLLIGSGYLHGISDENDIKVGFFFDHTYGVPIIPASSVKGKLRSFFEGEFLEEKKRLIEDILKKPINLEALKEEIFEKKDSIYNRDIFLDAPIKGELKDDYITPHRSPFADPIPIRFIKISSGAKVTFRFILHDGIISANEKFRLFINLLTLGGIGAKTNTGYGAFEEMNLELSRYLKEKEAQQKQKQKEAELQKLSPEERIIKEYQELNDNFGTLIKKMQNNEIEADYKKLASLIKKELQKNPKTWDKAKLKALKRKKYIESLLK